MSGESGYGSGVLGVELEWRKLETKRTVRVPTVRDVWKRQGFCLSFESLVVSTLRYLGGRNVSSLAVLYGSISSVIP